MGLRFECNKRRISWPDKKILELKNYLAQSDCGGLHEQTLVIVPSTQELKWKYGQYSESSLKILKNT